MPDSDLDPVAGPRPPRSSSSAAGRIPSPGWCRECCGPARRCWPCSDRWSPAATGTTACRSGSTCSCAWAAAWSWELRSASCPGGSPATSSTAPSCGSPAASCRSRRDASPTNASRASTSTSRSWPASSGWRNCASRWPAAAMRARPSGTSRSTTPGGCGGFCSGGRTAAPPMIWTPTPSSPSSSSSRGSSPERVMLGTVLSLDFLGAALGSVGVLAVALWFDQVIAFLGGIIPLVTWLGQIVGKRVLTQWDFTLTRSDDGLRIERGLLSRTSQSIPFERVQGIAVEEPYVWRRLGWQRLEVDVAGYGSQGDRRLRRHQLHPAAHRRPGIGRRGHRRARARGPDVARAGRARSPPSLAVRAHRLAVPVGGHRRRRVRRPVRLAPAHHRRRAARPHAVGRAEAGAVAASSRTGDGRGPHAEGTSRRRRTTSRRSRRATHRVRSAGPRPAGPAAARQLTVTRRWWRPRRRRRAVSSARGSRSQPSGSTTFLGVPCRPRGVPSWSSGYGSDGSSSGEQLVERRVRRHRAEPLAHDRADREALEVPGHVLAELDAAALLAEPLAQQLGVPAHDGGDLAERRQLLATGARRRTAAARSRNSHGRPRQPRPTMTPSQPVCSHHARPRRRPPRCRRCRAPGSSTAAFSAAMASQSARPE